MWHHRQTPGSRAWAVLGCGGLATGLMLLVACGATAASGPSGQVTVAPSQQQFGTHDRVGVTIMNGLANMILAADHQSNCTILTIQHLDGQTWQPQNPCLLKSPTQLVTLAAGKATSLQLDPPSGPGASGWEPGIYRLVFTYRMSQTGSETTITSSQLTIV